jgi:hypothetical protein
MTSVNRACQEVFAADFSEKYITIQVRTRVKLLFMVDAAGMTTGLTVWRIVKSSVN